MPTGQTFSRFSSFTFSSKAEDMPRLPLNTPSPGHSWPDFQAHTGWLGGGAFSQALCKGEQGFGTHAFSPSQGLRAETEGAGTKSPTGGQQPTSFHGFSSAELPMSQRKTGDGGRNGTRVSFPPALFPCILVSTAYCWSVASPGWGPRGQRGRTGRPGGPGACLSMQL